MTTADALYTVKVTINGQPYEVQVPARRTLVDMLRYDLDMTRTKETCSVGVCGACTVLINDEIAASCITLAVQADGATITTIEGVANGEALHPLQQSFIDHGGFQCGICTSGQIVAAKSLLDSNPSPTEDQVKEWMMGNLCRCTGYYQIMESIMRAAK